MSGPPVSFETSARALMNLLEPYDGPLPGVEKLTPQERDFMIVTAASELILHMIARRAGADYANGLIGLDALAMEARLAKICNMMRGAN